MSKTRVYFFEHTKFTIPEKTANDYGMGDAIDLNVLLNRTFFLCGASSYQLWDTEKIWKVVHEYGILHDVNFLERLKELTTFALGGEIPSTASKVRDRPKEPSKIDGANDWFHRVVDEDEFLSRHGHAAIVFEFDTVRDGDIIDLLTKSTETLNTYHPYRPEE